MRSAQNRNEQITISETVGHVVKLQPIALAADGSAIDDDWRITKITDDAVDLCNERTVVDPLASRRLAQRGEIPQTQRNRQCLAEDAGSLPAVTSGPTVAPL